MSCFSRFIFIAAAVHLLHLLSVAAALGNLPTPFFPEDDFAVNCGSSGRSTALDGREWVGEAALRFTSTLRQSVVSSTAAHSLFVDPVPYMTARISRSEFTYRFRVKPGQKFIRLHFYPASYKGFERSKALFDVRAGPYTLLANFSASLAAEALGVQCFLKEYCVNVEEDAQMLSITFSASRGGTNQDVYAFVNGIEIVSMPTALYYSGDDDLGPRVAGKKFRFYIDSSTALELVHRLNVGGRSILPLQDLGMYRLWSEDKNYLFDSDVFPATTTVIIKYTDNWKYAGPPKLYQTAWAVSSNPQSTQRHNYTWKLPVDLGFRYLVRLHFCDPQPKTTETARKKFSVFINNQIAESEADVIRWSGGRGIAVYRDYVVSMGGKRMEAKRDLIIALLLTYEHSSGQIEAITMNGIEIFKLSNPDNDLAGPNPASRSRNRTWWASKLQIFVLVWGRANAIATVAFGILTLLNIIVFQLTIWKPNDGQMNISSSSSSLPTEDVEEQGCRLFSLVEIQLATNNFHEKFVIGSGGFGKVYRGLMDGGTKVVAIKRLNPESKQGAEEFWAEVETLSKFQHTNLVSLLGYYEDLREMLLVYEYVAGGSLADHLYRSSGNSMSGSPLSWEQRLIICIGAARGLNYLHTGGGEQDGVIHRDVKSSNILLDQNLVAKISDFGLCKMFSARPARTHVTTKVKGTFGFMDPDYFVTHRLTFKSDVYAFGVVLLEVVCGRPALDRRVAEDKHSLALWVRQCITEGTLDQIVDPSLRDQITARCLRVFVEIASKCLQNQPNERPSMSDLVGGLEYALELQGRPDAYAEEEEAVSILGQPGRVHTIAEETVHTNINAALQDSYVSGDHIGQSGLILENFSRNEMDVSILPIKSKGTTLPPKRGKIKSSLKWWNSIWRRGKRSKSEFFEAHADLGMEVGGCRRFSFSEIRAATNNFERVLGMGGFGRVYFGQMGNVRMAIKISSVGSRMAAQAFRTEVEMLSRLRHINLVSLLGYCEDEGELILVYDYMSNGNLQSQLYDRGNDPLPWKRRLHICVGAARGLHYLHTGAEFKIIHRDVKPTNILLDETWVAKITDFALSKLGPDGMSATAVTTAVKGTYGYLAPDYVVTGRLTEKSDVYSFGVVLFEVLCAKPVISNWSDEERMHLVELVTRGIRHKTLYQTIDPCLKGKIAPVCFKTFVEIAASCLHSSPTRRPSMADVVEKLQYSLGLQESMESGAEGIHFDGQFDVYDVDVNPEGGLPTVDLWGANTWASNTWIPDDSPSRDELLSGPR